MNDGSTSLESQQKEKVPLLLRLKCRSGQHVIRHLFCHSTVSDLVETVCEISGLKRTRLCLFTGYPPKQTDLRDGKRSLDAVGIRSGDTLIAEALGIEQILKMRFNDGCVSPIISPRGLFMKKVVPADNNCLFTSVYFIVSGGDLEPGCAVPLRQIIANAVSSNTDTYSDAFLGKANKEYCHWIQNEQHWGGAIELSILSDHFGLELAVVDAQSGRIDRFGENRNFICRGFLLYDGIHFDPLMMECTQGPSLQNFGNTQDSVVTIFDIEDDVVFQMALEVGAEAKTARSYTDVHRFVLRCLVCNETMTGQQGALQHAKDTGHSNFDEC